MTLASRDRHGMDRLESPLPLKREESPCSEVVTRECLVGALMLLNWKTNQMTVTQREGFSVQRMHDLD